PWVYDGLRRMNRFPVQRTHTRDLFDNRVVEIAIYAEPVIEHFSAVEIVGEFWRKLRNRISLARAKLTLRTFNTRATPVPDLSFRISRPHKQRVLRILSGCDDGH